MLFTLVLIALIAFASAGQKKCAQNEIWTPCSGCELKCGEPYDKCRQECLPPSCECAAWTEMRRADDGKCIPEYKCPQNQITA
uniref:TIL domain-containing protein n=1 Tax=Ascaris lumbricoides TaxID=6252 RepID=A0A0M3HN17_ASCLU